MYFSRIILQEDAQNAPDFWRVFRDPYSLHQAIWQMFADHADRKRDFIYRLDQDGKRPLIYTVSERKPDMGLGLWYIETKEYEPKIRTDMQLAFMLRVNPVRTKRDENRKQHRHDVVMEAKTRLKQQGTKQNERNPLATLVQEEGCNWLMARAEKHGFVINPIKIRADGYQQHRFFKKKGSRSIQFSTLDFNGILTVIDPDLFIETLYKGIGSAKGFGCGMMMVKRV
ncbi:MAG: type I-E CRISPR-associated protein Cas6/Cse3/CasE [Proteobacteria bacterium]|nr:type I-E CRISPR-associated protein Cas6/Cse3/CasE [Pseudomonadota bacterium]